MNFLLVGNIKDFSSARVGVTNPEANPYDCDRENEET